MGNEIPALKEEQVTEGPGREGKHVLQNTVNDFQQGVAGQRAS